MSFFRKFYENIIHDRKPENDTIKVKGKETPVFYGTVAPYPNFNASKDAAVLQSAIQSKGVDEDVIVSILVQRNNEQRQKIKAVYEASNGQSLEQALKRALKSDLEDMALALLMPPAHFDAHLIRDATKRLGTNEDVLVEVLATRSNEAIRELKRVYKEEYRKDVENIIKDETSGDFTKALLAMLAANKDESTAVDMALAQKDAEQLFDACENRRGVDISTFLDILTKRSGPQLSKTFQRYASLSDMTLPKALNMGLSGDIENCLLDVVKCAWNTPAFFAEKLHQAMKRHGTCEDTLIRVLVSRSEVDLKKILEEYRAMYDTTLQEDILKDTKNHFENILLGLCGPH